MASKRKLSFNSSETESTESSSSISSDNDSEWIPAKKTKENKSKPPSKKRHKTEEVCLNALKII